MQIPLTLRAIPLSQGGLQALPPLSKGGAATAAVGFKANHTPHSSPHVLRFSCSILVLRDLYPSSRIVPVIPVRFLLIFQSASR